MPRAQTTKRTTKSKAAPKSSQKTPSSRSFSLRGLTLASLQKKVKDPKNRRSLIIAGVIIVLAVVIYFTRGILIAATVNGQPISRLAIIRDLERQSGQLAVESAITRALVFQEARKKNINVTDKDIDSEIAKIEKQFSDQGQDLNQLLAAQGLTRERFREEVRIQIMVTRILGDDAKVTDKEFNDFMANNQDLITEGENEATARATLRQQMEQQKLAQKYQEWIANVKKNAKINYFVEY